VCDPQLGAEAVKKELKEVGEDNRADRHLFFAVLAIITRGVDSMCQVHHQLHYEYHQNHQQKVYACDSINSINSPIYLFLRVSRTEAKRL
jgi:hypothetical protein